MPNNEDRRREAPVARQIQEPARKGVRSFNPVELWRGLNPQLRPVLAGAAVTAIFIGLGLGLFHSRAPLANPANHASNGVTLTTGGVTLQAGAAKPQPAQPVAAQPAQAKPQPGHSGNAPAATSAAKPSPRVQHLSPQQAEQEIGDDVVVRHFSRPVPTQKPKQAGQQAGLKQFSDLEN